MLNLKYRLGQYQFNTLVSVAGEDLFDLAQSKIIKRVNSSTKFFSKNPTVIVADPFLFTYKKELFLFFEEQINLRGKGVIKMTKTADLNTWSEPIVVLEESFHLSYPYVFETAGQVYMLPETGQNKSIRLYKPNENLQKWEYHKTLISGKHFLDSCVIKRNNTHFLITTDYSDKVYYLRIYFSDSIDGEWKEHPASPVVHGADCARCAGSLFYYKGKLFRPCQLTADRYGNGVEIYEIEKLDEKEFKEHRIKQIIPNIISDYKFGGHHINICNFNSKLVIATDSLQLRSNFWEILRRIKYKLWNKE